MPTAAEFSLDSRLVRDTFALARWPLSHVLLMNDAEIPWLILVPETVETEVCDLEPRLRRELMREVDRSSRSLRRAYPRAKLNVAAIGNVVRQLHVHVVARREDDYLWPGVVWGSTPRRRYRQDEVTALAARLNLAAT